MSIGLQNCLKVKYILRYYILMQKLYPLHFFPLGADESIFLTFNFNNFCRKFIYLEINRLLFITNVLLSYVYLNIVGDFSIW